MNTLNPEKVHFSSYNSSDAWEYAVAYVNFVKLAPPELPLSKAVLVTAHYFPYCHTFMNEGGALHAAFGQQMNSMFAVNTPCAQNSHYDPELRTDNMLLSQPARSLVVV